MFVLLVLFLFRTCDILFNVNCFALHLCFQKLALNSFFFLLIAEFFGCPFKFYIHAENSLIPSPGNKFCMSAFNKIIIMLIMSLIQY